MEIDIRKIVEETRTTGKCSNNSQLMKELVGKAKEIYPDVNIYESGIGGCILLETEDKLYEISVLNHERTKTSSYDTNYSSLPPGTTGFLCTTCNTIPKNVKLETEIRSRRKKMEDEFRNIGTEKEKEVCIIVLSNSPTDPDRHVKPYDKELEWYPMKTENRNMSCFDEYNYSIVKSEI